MNYSLLIFRGGHDDSNILSIDWTNFGLQCLNCIMICALSFQSEVFHSTGYMKFVTQTDGSMDLLMKLAEQKAKSIAYIFNNKKIRKII